jgi:hypothetical protein
MMTPSDTDIKRDYFEGKFNLLAIARKYNMTTRHVAAIVRPGQDAVLDKAKPIDRAVDITIEGVPEEIKEWLLDNGLRYLTQRTYLGATFFRITVWADTLPLTIFAVENMPVGRLKAMEPCLPGVWRGDCSNCGCHEYHLPDDYICVFCRDACTVGE